jgi:hypothetical protein
MKKRLPSMIAFVALCGTALLAQNPNPTPDKPRFEVASIKPVKVVGGSSGGGSTSRI